MSAKQIGIAIVEDDGRFLVGVRGASQALAGCAEFPGGKCELGEAPEACAIRECFEETGLRVETVRLLDQRQFVYSHATVDLHFWLCRPVSRNGESLNGFHWVDRATLSSLPFPEANQHVVRILTDLSAPNVCRNAD